MSEDAPVFGEHNTRNEEASTSLAEANGIQIETIKELDGIISNFIAENSSIHDACRFLTITLEENPSLTPGQHSQTYRMYGQCLEEAYAAHMRAIA